MRQALPVAILALGLSGCVWFGKDDPEPVLPAKSETNSVDLYADGNDLIMARAAAAVQVAREANKAGLAGKVEAELNIAGTYLPRPPIEDLEAARRRADQADPSAYAEALKIADTLSRSLDDLWAKVEAEKTKARLALEEKEAARAADLKAKELELVQARKDKAATLFTLFGVIASAVGLGLFIWGDKIGATKPEAGAVLLAGAAAASLPWITESEVAPWILGGVGVLLGLRVAAWAWTSGWRRKGGDNGTV